MVKYREILRLTHLGISQRNIAFSCGCAASTVQAVQQAARAKRLEWPLPEEMDDAAIYRFLYPPRDRKSPDKAPIDHELIEREMGKRGVTMVLLWNEYCDKALASGKEPLMYSSFCQRHRDWASRNGVTMHIDRSPAQEIMVDWCGDTMQICDQDTGEILKVYVFVGCLPFSSYVYAEGFLDMGEESWVEAHAHMYGAFGGTAPVLVPYNCKTAIAKNAFDELVVNEQYRRMCEHYGVAVVPARPRRPKDKASVEMNVNVVQRRAMAPLRNSVFFTLVELNEALSANVAAINAAPFQKRESSRESIFLGQEKELLQPLPPTPYEMVTKEVATVQFNYHVAFDGRYYSVPFNYVRREVSIAATKRMVAISCDGIRVAGHPRSYGPKGTYVTVADHMPDSHRDYAEWNGDRFRRWAARTGESTAAVVDGMLKSKKVEQQAYRTCRALLALGERHGGDLLERACTKALTWTARPSYKTVKAVIARLSEDEEATSPNDHAYLRGGDYYRGLDDEAAADDDDDEPEGE